MKISCVLGVILSVLVSVECIPSLLMHEYDHDMLNKKIPPKETRIGREEKSPQFNFDGFDRFIDGLGKLQEALNNPDYDWSQMSAAQPDGVPSEADNPSESGSDSQALEDIQSSLKDFLVLIEVMNQLTQTQTTTPSPVSRDDLHYLREVEGLLKNIISTYSDPVATNEDHPPAEQENEGQSLDDALNRVSEVFRQVFGNQTLYENQTQGTGPNEAADNLRKSLGMLERARLDYQNSTDSSGYLQHLRNIIEELHSLTGRSLPGPAEHEDGLLMAMLNTSCQTNLQCEQNDEFSICGEDSRCICREGYIITEYPQIGLACTLAPPPEPPVLDPKAPCTSPYIEIAYRMCVLPVYDLRYSWNQALLYCRTRGLQLATDAVVVKVRRYFNNELGEEGSRVRWPLWVGAKKQSNDNGEEQWKWHDDTTVASFLWPEGNPRSYQTRDAPEGVCMVLDGYQQYKADGLPCHLKRRFICQRPT